MEITFEQLPKVITQLFDEVIIIKQLLLEKSIRTNPSEDKLLTVQEAAEFLTLSVPTIYGLVSKSHLPVSKKGKRLYFSKQELITWIKTGRKKTHDEIAADSHDFLKAKKR